jgi:hypothetical protein
MHEASQALVFALPLRCTPVVTGCGNENILGGHLQDEPWDQSKEGGDGRASGWQLY